MAAQNPPQDRRKSERIGDRRPVDPAKYTLEPVYSFEEFQTELNKAGNNPLEQHVRHFWRRALERYFNEDEAFLVNEEGSVSHETQELADIIVVKIVLRPQKPAAGGGDVRARVATLVIECKGPTPAKDHNDWRGIGQALDYAKSLCRKDGIDGIWYGVAHGTHLPLLRPEDCLIISSSGRLVRFFEYKKHGGSVPLKTSKEKPLDPMDVVNEHEYIHEALLQIKATPHFKVGTMILSCSDGSQLSCPPTVSRRLSADRSATDAMPRRRRRRRLGHRFSAHSLVTTAAKACNTMSPAHAYEGESCDDNGRWIESAGADATKQRSGAASGYVALHQHFVLRYANEGTRRAADVETAPHLLIRVAIPLEPIVGAHADRESGDLG